MPLLDCYHGACWVRCLRRHLNTQLPAALFLPASLNPVLPLTYLYRPDLMTGAGSAQVVPDPAPRRTPLASLPHLDLVDAPYASYGYNKYIDLVSLARRSPRRAEPAQRRRTLLWLLDHTLPWLMRPMRRMGKIHRPSFPCLALRRTGAEMRHHVTLPVTQSHSINTSHTRLLAHFET